MMNTAKATKFVMAESLAYMYMHLLHIIYNNNKY